MANLTVKIMGQLDGSLQAAINGATSALNGFGKGGKGSTSAIGTAAQLAGTAIIGTAKAGLVAMGAIAAGSAVAIKKAVNVGQEFENSMSTLASTAGIDRTSEAYEHMSEVAMSVGAVTNKSASECAEAMTYMALAGWDLNDMYSNMGENGKTQLENVTDAMVKMSSATGQDLGTVSDLVTDSMSALGLGLEDFSGYMDLAANINNRANTTATQFMETMLGAGGSARSLGVNMSDLATATGILANNGVKGSEAGTALNSMLSRLSGNTTARKELDALGISLFNEEGKFRGLESVLQDVNTAMDGFADTEEGAEARAASMQKIFGTNYKNEAAFLLDAVRAGTDGTASAWSKLEEKLGDSTGALEEMYKRATDNLQGDLDVMSSAASAFGIDFYNAIVGDTSSGLRGTVRTATEYILQLRDAFNANGLSGLASEIPNVIGQIATNIGGEGGNFIQAGMDFATQFMQGVQENGEAIGGAAANLITSFAAAFPTYTAEFAEAGLSIVQGIADGLTTAGADGSFPTERIMQGIVDGFSDFGSYLTENAPQLGEAAGELIAQLATGLGEHAGDLLEAGLQIVTGIVEGIGAAAPEIIAAVPQIVSGILTGLAENAPQLLEAGKNLALTIVDGILSTGNAIAEAVLGLIDAAGGIVDYGANYGEMYGEAYVGSLTEYIAAHGPELTQQVQQYIGENLSQIGHTYADTEGFLQMFQLGDVDLSGLQEMAQTAPEAAEALSIINGLMAQFASESPEMQAAAEAATAAMEADGQAAESASESVEAAADSANRFTEQLENMGDTTVDTSEITASVEEVQAAMDSLNATDITANLVEAATSGADLTAISDSVTECFSAIDTAVNTTFTNMSTVIPSTMTTVSTSVTTAFTEMTTAVSTGCADIVSTCNSCAQQIVAAFASLPGELSAIGANAMASLQSSIESAGAGAVAAAQSIADQISSIMASALQIGSPSKVMKEIGMWTMKGLELGIVDNSEPVLAGTQAVGEAIPGQLSAGLRRENVVSNAAYGSAGIATDAGSDGGFGGINFAPNITIQGNANEGDVRNALAWSMDEFRRMYDQMKRYDRRASFA